MQLRQRSLWCVACLLSIALYSRAAEPDPLEAARAMVDAERKFYQTGQEKGTRAAFLAFLADDGIVFRPGPLNGKEAWGKRPETGFDLDLGADLRRDVAQRRFRIRHGSGEMEGEQEGGKIHRSRTVHFHLEETEGRLVESGAGLWNRKPGTNRQTGNAPYHCARRAQGAGELRHGGKRPVGNPTKIYPGCEDRLGPRDTQIRRA